MIYIVFAPPGDGKTFFCTREALMEMRRKGKNKRKVFANYPIYDKKTGVFCYEWYMDLIYDLRDSVVIIDEAYRDVSSREHRDFTVDQHTAFATNRHNNNDFWIIAQSPARVDVIIREMTNVFFCVKKRCIPFTKRPLWFVVEGYLDEKSISDRHNVDKPVYSSELMLPRKYIKEAYDTHFFGHDSGDREYSRWFDDSVDPEDPEDSGQIAWTY